MSLGKFPRIIDGPFASWGGDDDMGQIVLANGSTLKLGQPLCIDITKLGPDNNVPNNAINPPLCEQLVATTSTNAGDIFGVVTGVTSSLPKNVTLSQVQGIPTWTNSTGGNVTLTVDVRQVGWAYVYAGTAAIGQTGGNSILVGSRLITTSAQPFAIQGSSAIGSTVGLALATAINTNQGGLTAGIPVLGNGAPAAAGSVISVVPQSIVGITPNTLVLIDSLAGGVQEQVSVGSISYPLFAIAVANAHPAGFKITGAQTTKSGVLISTVGTGLTMPGLVATFVNVGA